MFNRLSLRRPKWILAGILLFAGIGLTASLSAQERAKELPAPKLDEPASEANSETAVFAGGCFWGVQGVFQHVNGVTNAVSGYAGGDKASADYETVSSGTTGHAESVRVTYDPHKITYGRLLQIYFSVAHDPTELNRQGPDTGTQYRSALFPRDAEQAKVAKTYIEQLNAAHVFPSAIVTKIEPGREFFPAEDYHQDYLTLHPSQPYIAFNDMPKLTALKHVFPTLYRADPVLVSKNGTGD